MTDAVLAETPDPAILRAERRLQMIEELAQIGMDLARALHRQAMAPIEPTDSANSTATDASEASPSRADSAFDPSVAFARISRAIRMTLALEARTDEALRALRAGVAADVERRRFKERDLATSEAMAQDEARREAVERAVCEAAEREIEDEDALSDIYDALHERMGDDEAYYDLGNLPIRETVERLCADLELSPDWGRWEDEGWAPDPPYFRPPNSIFARSSRKPLMPKPRKPTAGARRLE